MELLILPLALSLVSLIIPKSTRRFAALLGALASIVIAVVHLTSFHAGAFVELFSSNHQTFFRMTYQMGYDGLGLAMILLTNVIVFVILLANFENVNIASNKMFNSMVFLMQFALLGVFTSFDLILFYIFWELSLIPVFLIAFWFGEKDRKRTLLIFFIYTFIGSLAMLFSIFYIGTSLRT